MVTKDPPPAIPQPANPTGLNYISGSGDVHYTDDPKDSKCANNWNYYKSDKKTLYEGNIPNITKINDTKYWCPLKTIKQYPSKENSRSYSNPSGLNYISGSPSNYWKNTDNKKDPECANNWNYYKKDGTLILGNIPNITKEGDSKNWCALKNPIPNANCVGSWSSWEPENCPTGTQTRTYTITTKQSGNGKSCDYEDKQVQSQSCSIPETSNTSSTSDTSPPPEPNVDCVASWGEFGDCIDGKKTKKYTVTKSSSGTGKACETFDGDTKTEDCSSAWYTNPLILGGIGAGILLLFLLLFFMMKKNSSVPVV